jgi:hypothetical protein
MKVKLWSRGCDSRGCTSTRSYRFAGAGGYAGTVPTAAAVPVGNAFVRRPNSRARSNVLVLLMSLPSWRVGSGREAQAEACMRGCSARCTTSCEHGIARMVRIPCIDRLFGIPPSTLFQSPIRTDSAGPTTHPPPGTSQAWFLAVHILPPARLGAWRGRAQHGIPGDAPDFVKAKSPWEAASRLQGKTSKAQDELL